MQFNRDKFFAGYKAHFDANLEQSHVDGLNFLLDHFESEPLWDAIPKIAYALATTFLETGHAMQPVEEGYYFKDPARIKRFQKGLRYYPYFGRGDVQLTWETPSKPNYSKATRKLRQQRPSIVTDFEARTGQTFDLAKYPEQALDPLIAFYVMTLGMMQGWFTGKCFDDYIDDDGIPDYTEMRRIINGTDKAGMISGYARWFERILRSALISDTSSTAEDPAGSKNSLPQQPAVNTVESPGPEVVSPPASGDGDMGTVQNAETIVNNAPATSITEKVSAVGDKVEMYSGILAKFGISNPLASTSIGTKLSVLSKNLLSFGGIVVAWITGHWVECLIFAAIVAAIGAWEWKKSRDRVAAEKAGLPVELLTPAKQ